MIMRKERQTGVSAKKKKVFLAMGVIVPGTKF